MKFLGIDTSCGGMVVAANGKKKSVRPIEGVTSVCIMGEIEGALKDVELRINDVDFIACVVGPGSFTGIRIGISTVKGLCFACGKQALALTSFDCIAYAEREKALALVDAGHGNYYACPFEKGVRGEPVFLSQEELVVYQEKGFRFLSGKPLAVGSEIVDTAQGLLEAAKKNAHALHDANALAALYLRKSSAEEGRK